MALPDDLVLLPRATCPHCAATGALILRLSDGDKPMLWCLDCGMIASQQTNP